MDVPVLIAPAPAPPTAPDQSVQAPTLSAASAPNAALAPSAAPAPNAVEGGATASTEARHLYRCRVLKQGQEIWSAITFPPKVAALCQRHPEMGPCQYERESCRRVGGRVFDADGVEITRKTEAEYDKRVLRLRFRS